MVGLTTRMGLVVCALAFAAFAPSVRADDATRPAMPLSILVDDTSSLDLATSTPIESSPEQASETALVPAAPSSLSLFLSAMASVGAWHVLRNARFDRLGSLPDWYHTGGPWQVGHRYAVSFDGPAFAAVPACDVETLLIRLEDRGWSLRPARVLFHQFLQSHVTRGPPA